MKRYNFSTKWTLLLLVLVVFSCSKEQIKTGGLSIFMPDQGVLVFEDFDDLIETMQATRQMDSAQLIAFEIERGYTSFGRVADDIYIAIIPEDTICFDSLQQYVQVNSAFLYLEEDGEGWHTLEARFDMYPQYYIMNLNRMYIVGDSAYKLFEEGLLYTSTENYLELVGVDNNDLHLYVEYPNYIFLPNETNGTKKGGAKDTQYDVGTYYPKPASRRATNGRHRNYLRIRILPKGYSTNPTVFNRNVDCLARPYYRVAGVWYWTQKKIDVSFRFRLDYVNTDTVQVLGVVVATPIIHSNRATAIHSYKTIFENDHFGGLDACAKTDHTGYARISINPTICY